MQFAVRAVQLLEAAEGRVTSLERRLREAQTRIRALELPLRKGLPMKPLPCKSRWCPNAPARCMQCSRASLFQCRCPGRWAAAPLLAQSSREAQHAMQRLGMQFAVRAVQLLEAAEGSVTSLERPLLRPRPGSGP